MGQIFLNPTGNGTATCDNPAPTDGEWFTITCTPDPGETLNDVRAFDSYDNPVAIPVQQIITMQFRGVWRNLYVDIYFSGGPTPPTPTVPVWLLFKIRERGRNVR